MQTDRRRMQAMMQQRTSSMQQQQQQGRFRIIYEETIPTVQELFS
jgi:hypothetical protein